MAKVSRRGKQRTFISATKTAKRIAGSPAGQAIKPRRDEQEKVRIHVPTSRSKGEGKLSPGTSARRNKGPEGGEDPVVFVTYSPQPRPKDTSIVNHYPPDPSGDASEPGIILQTGNDYIRYSKDKGQTFQMLANTAVIDNSFAGGENGDQVMLFVPAVQCFVWYLQFKADASSNGAFRIAYAKLSDLTTKLKGVWKVYDWASADFNLPGVNFDYPDMAATETFLYVTTGTESQGRLMMRFNLSDFAAGSVAAEYTALQFITKDADKSKDSLRYAHFCQGADRGLWAGHVDNATLRIFEWPDNSSSVTPHDITTTKWPNSTDYSSKCRMGPTGFLMAAMPRFPDLCAEKTSCGLPGRHRVVRPRKGALTIQIRMSCGHRPHVRLERNRRNANLESRLRLRFSGS
jgi:hypothetical protein